MHALEDIVHVSPGIRWASIHRKVYKTTQLIFLLKRSVGISSLHLLVPAFIMILREFEVFVTY